MTDRPNLSKAELEVARIVWSQKAATVRQVLEAMPASREIDYKTVQTFLRRLEAKGYVHACREGRGIVYTPKVRPAKVIRETIEDFIRRLFDGEALPLVEYLVQDRGLTKHELSQLRAMLRDAERRTANPPSSPKESDR